ncbi:hypothetical protein [Paenibacillus tuaregi]|uniref:hypothetical protein n=1 Tax=Paenibacillus tuaregi TaxID=1816681 RepID=UPI000837B880|nr:hypothetical protein [Paenibacillus tuaregi]
MPNYYAQIDSKGRVEGLSALSGEVQSEFLVPIDEKLYGNENLLFTRYVKGEFTGYLAELKADKESIPADGTEDLTVHITIHDWNGEVHRDYQEPISIEVAGIRQQVQSVKGTAEITISSEEPGEFKVRTLGLDRDAELKVVILDVK